MPRHRLLLATIIVAAGSVFLINTGKSASAPLEVSPADPAIRYSGRFDPAHGGTAPRCEWPASMVTVKFSGTAISAKFSDSGRNFWQVEIDGKPAAKLELQAAAQVYEIATGLPGGEHIVTLTKATEASAGPTRFLGFQLEGGARLLPPPPVIRRIEVIGDSISCGYGVQAADQHEHFTPATESAYDAYGAVAARKLGADYTCIAWSGRKLWPDNTITELYDRTLPNEPASKWDFTAWTPDVVVINLGTNDFARANPDETAWIGAYRKFIARLRSNYPKAAIYCATGPMLIDDSPRNPKTTLLAYIQKIVAAENAAGDTNIRALDFGQQSPENGFGADWHPSRKTDQLMADKLVEALQRDLGWK